MNNIPGATGATATHALAMIGGAPEAGRASEGSVDRAAFDMSLALATEETVTEAEPRAADGDRQDGEEEDVEGSESGEVSPYFGAFAAPPPPPPEMLTTALLAVAEPSADGRAPLAPATETTATPAPVVEELVDATSSRLASDAREEPLRMVTAEEVSQEPAPESATAAAETETTAAPSAERGFPSGSPRLPRSPAAAPAEPHAARTAGPSPELGGADAGRRRAPTHDGPTPSEATSAFSGERASIRGRSAAAAAVEASVTAPAASVEDRSARATRGPGQVEPLRAVAVAPPTQSSAHALHARMSADAKPPVAEHARASGKRGARDFGVGVPASGDVASVGAGHAVDVPPAPVGVSADGVKTVAAVNVPAAAADAARPTDRDIESGIRAAEAVGHRRALGSEARGRIELPELGAVEVRAHAERAHIDVHVEVEKSHAKSLLMANAPELAAHVQREVPEARIHVDRTFIQPNLADPGTMRDFGAGQRERGREPSEQHGGATSRSEATHVDPVTPRGPKARVRIVL